MRKQKKRDSSNSKTHINAGRNAFLIGCNFYSNPYRDSEARHYWEIGFKQAKFANDRYRAVYDKGPQQFEQQAADAKVTPEEFFYSYLAKSQPFHPQVAPRYVAPVEQPVEDRPKHRPATKWKGKQNQPNQPKKPFHIKNTIGQNLKPAERKAVWATAKRGPALAARPRP